MKGSGFLIRRSLRQMIGDPVGSAIIVFSLTVSTFAALMLSSAAADAYLELAAKEDLKRGYYISFAPKDAPTNGGYPLLGELFSDSFPEVEEFFDLRAVPVHGSKALAAVYRGGDTNEPSERHMLSGRGFTEEEISAGADVVILNETDANGAQIGETAVINGREYTVVGIADSRSDSCLPLRSAMKDGGYSVSFGYVRFSETPTASQDEVFRELIAGAGGGGVTLEYDLWGRGDVKDIRKRLYSLAVMIFAAGLMISEVFGYTVKSRLREFNIYKLLGISGRALFAAFYLPVAAMLAASLALGYAGYALTEPFRRLVGIDAGAEGIVACADFAAVALLMLAVTLPKYISVLHSGVTGGEDEP